MKAFSAATLAACVAAAFGVSAHAQQYPTKAIRIVVPLAAGGGNDTIARMIGQKITPTLGQQVVVDNRPGAGGIIAAEMIAKSPPDGYNLLLANVAGMTIIPNSQKKIPYDPFRDFQPVSLIAQAPLLVVVHPSLPVKNLKELVALAKAKPNQINYASNGVGTSTHLATELFAMLAGVKITHIPYKGVALAMTDIMSGQVPLMFSSAVTMLPHVKGGKLRALAMTGATRSAIISDVPTVAEAGVKGYEAGSWYGIVAPANTPRPVVDRLYKEISTAVKSKDVQDRLINEAVIPIGNTPEEFAAYIKVEFDRMARVIKSANIVLD